MSTIPQVNVPRIEDLPYFSSPPVQFVYESLVNVALGLFTWADQPSPLTPLRNVMENAVYYIRSVSLFADIDEFDFQEALVISPSFQIYKPSEATVHLFKEPIIMNTFLRQFDFRSIYMTAKTNDQILCSFSGVIAQTPALVGKANVTLKAVLSVQEINDDRFIEIFREKYPNVKQQVFFKTNAAIVEGYHSVHYNPAERLELAPIGNLPLDVAAECSAGNPRTTRIRQSTVIREYRINRAFL